MRAGANDIELLINDNSGATQTLHFDAFSSATLLSAGASEWSMAAGVPSYYKDGGTAYVDNQIFGTGFYRYGLSDQLTLEAQAQGDNHVAMAGVSAVTSTPFGIFSVNVATSVADGGVGVGGAAGVTWELANKENTESLRLSAEMHTDDFRTPGQLQFEPTGIILPVYDFKDRISATYNLALDDAWQAAVTARYDVDNPNFLTGNPLVAHGDRYHVDLSLSHPLFDNATISGTFGYSNEIYNRSFAEQLNLDNTKPEFWAGLRLIWRPDSKTTISASSDTLNRRSQTTANYQTGTGIDDWAANVAVSDDRFSRSTGISADVNYHGQRAEVTVGQDLNESTFGRSDASANQRTRVRVGTAFVFADGAAAIAAPVRGDGGFAILDPHVSIGDRTVTSGTPGNIRGKSDAFGPAVVSGLPGYSQQNLPIDVADLPTGYSLGESGFDLKPPYKAGYKLVVGSSYSVSALGELKDTSGDAVGLATGIASDGQKQVTVFTNQSGKFAADGLAPGEWKLVMDSEAGPLTYVLKIPSDTQGLLRLGTLNPVKG